MSKTKAAITPLYSCKAGDYFLPFFFPFLTGSLGASSFSTVGCHHHDAVVLHTGIVAPFFGFEIPLDGKHRALGELVE